ncbi:hypothetical protein F5883DRAFT_570391 [Diaporthe sp. PMI_573]|nr:hypothetical protein F5883DRAFT_570391 [Diaporthaceae sp. PMI_573]
MLSKGASATLSFLSTVYVSEASATLCFYQLFIGLTAVCSTFRLLFSSPKLTHKVDNSFIHLLVLLLRRHLKSCLFPLTLQYLSHLFRKIWVGCDRCSPGAEASFLC